MRTSWGRHIKVTVEGGDPDKLRDTQRVAEFLASTCQALGMRPLDIPRVYAVAEQVALLDDPQEDEGGVTGFLVLSTSHISFHGWPLRDGLGLLDVFSCRDFSLGAVVRKLREYFEPDGGGMHVRVTDVSTAMRTNPSYQGPIALSALEGDGFLAVYQHTLD